MQVQEDLGQQTDKATKEPLLCILSFKKLNRTRKEF
jgi:hypothetical protein